MTTPEMQPGKGEPGGPQPDGEAEGGAGAVALALGTGGLALAGEVERHQLDDLQDRARGGSENRDQGVDSER